MDSQDVFADHQAIVAALPRMTVAALKDTLKDFNNVLDRSRRMVLSGKKQDLIDRVIGYFQSLMSQGDSSSYSSAKKVLEGHAGVRISFLSRRAPAQWPPSQSIRSSSAHANHSGANGWTSHPPSANPRPTIQGSLRFGSFRYSPFYLIMEYVAGPTVCPETQGQVKNSSFMELRLSSSQRENLRNHPTSFQVRMFCTTYTAHSASIDPRHPAPIEFPIVCDVRVNRAQLSVNLRGKKTAAKVQPPNLNKDGKLNLSGAQNVVELAYSNTNQAYVITAAICQVRSVESLTSKVQTERYKSKEEILRDMKHAANDDDIEVGDVAIGLKCPLSYMRLKNPSRSSICTHTQCFDVHSFFSLNEQTPTWQCPICSKTVDPDKLFLDGYVQDILNRVPEDEETVLIDGVGRWRTPNNRYTSDDTVPFSTFTTPPVNDGNPLASNSRTPTTPLVKGEDDSHQSLPQKSTPPNGVSERSKKIVEVLELDETPSPSTTTAVEINTALPNSEAQANNADATHTSTSDVPGETTTSIPLGAGASGPPQDSTTDDVIDLTLSDSDNEEPRRPLPAPRFPRLNFPQPIHRQSTHSSTPRTVAHSHPAWEILGRISGAPPSGLNGRQATASHYPEQDRAQSATLSASPINNQDGEHSSVELRRQYESAEHQLNPQPSDDLQTCSTAANVPHEKSSAADGSAPVPDTDPVRALKSTAHGSEHHREESSDESDNVVSRRKRPRHVVEESDDILNNEFADFDYDELDLDTQSGLIDSRHTPATQQNQQGALPDEGELDEVLIEDERAGLSSVNL